MKNTFNILSLFSAFLLIIYISGCKKQPTPPDYSKIEVREEFSENPPIATDIKIQLLEKPLKEGNILFTATLPKDKISDIYLAVMISENEKVVLHDDGKTGDKEKGDGIYSIVLNENIDHLNAYLSNQLNSDMDRLKGQEILTTFKGRNMIRIDKKIIEKQLSMYTQDAFFDLKEPLDVLDILDFSKFFFINDDFKKKCLLITDTRVVEDPERTYNPCTEEGELGGVWTFGKLISEMANSSSTGISAEDFMLEWLNSWKDDHTINGDVVSARNNIQNIINTWQNLSGINGLDVKKAPFKLLAIVNRFDLRNNAGYGGGNAGEGRFVFCAVDANCNPIPFLVIFEYGVNKTKCVAIHEYAEQWAALEGLTIGSNLYNTALQAITDQFTLAGTNPKKPNQSSLNQIRTNEIRLASPWELREFNIDKASHFLINVTTKREPIIPFNGNRTVVDLAKAQAFGEFVNINEALAIADKLDIPETISIGGVSNFFLAGKAQVPNDTFHWNGIMTPVSSPGHIVNDTARHHISLNTCSGCHGGETDTRNFTHVGLPSTSGGPATLSKFLTGDPPFSSLPFSVSDRANRPIGGTVINWEFNDLDRRGKDLKDFLNIPCLLIFPFPQQFKENDFLNIVPPSLILARILTSDPMQMVH